GDGGHGGMPHTTVDPIIAAAHIITAVQSIVSRNIDPTDPAVVSIGTIHAGQQFNIVPDAAKLTGTTRALNETTRTKIRDRFDQIAQQTAAGLGCTAAIEWDIGYPTTVNDPAFTGNVRDLVSQSIGEPNIVDLKAPSMGAEDFSYYGRAVPSCFVLLGLKPKDQESYPSVHTPRFDFNDDALATGIRMMCRIALDADS
ncbi:MAG: peptidase M20, partial [Planctomycetaceae bacterium]|nr:peptidase M20 [Planctomycetaceae bacterium]